MDTPATFGRYEVIERVGRGGMGMLYRGQDPVLDREVAIKVMSGDFSADEGAAGRVSSARPAPPHDCSTATSSRSSSSPRTSTARPTSPWSSCAAAAWPRG